jgi:hypothetical protein
MRNSILEPDASVDEAPPASHPFSKNEVCLLFLTYKSLTTLQSELAGESSLPEPGGDIEPFLCLWPGMS